MKLDTVRNLTGKKKALAYCAIAFGVAFLVLLLVTGAFAVASLFLPGDEGGSTEVYLYEPDYEYDITEDTEYMALDRRVWVCEGALSAPIDDNDYSDNPLYVFFQTYFNALFSGDGTALRDCYTDECVAALRIPYKLPMQRVYDILLTYISEETLTDASGDAYTEYVYRFEYKIKRNDGVFRPDLWSDSVRPQLLTVRLYGKNAVICDAVSNFGR